MLPSQLSNMTRQVTAVYAKKSTVARFSIGAQASVHDLKQQACSELVNKAQRYGFMNGFPCADIGSIALSSGINLLSEFPSVVT